MQTMPDPVTELDLVAYVDDQLDPWRRVAVEAHLAADPSAAARVMADLRARDELRLAFADPLPHEAPETRAAARKLARGLGLDRLLVRLAPMAAVLVLGGLIGAGAAGLGPLRVSHVVASEPPPAFIQTALEAHEAGRLRLSMLSQPAATRLDAAEIRAKTGILLPGLPADWQVQDVQIFPSPQGPSVEMALETPGLGRLSLFAVRPGSFRVALPDATQAGGRDVAWFQIGEVAHVLVAEAAPPDALREAADGLSRTLY
ncbi:zf-HC2 domain-containing protein [Cereibacter azotoformans]|nr:zf-HC2 domain-containing protein [Cereibacter azotoformans]ULB11998.1 zf-HC2 domain-containing protein [Cereibacter azotoformans]